MKKILILSYYFPPLGMGGTQRAAKFAKYLPEFGWEPTVVTVKPVAYIAQDESQLDELGHVRIIRTESWDPQRLLAKRGQTTVASGGSRKKSWMHWVNQNVLPFLVMPDAKRLWKVPLLRELDRLMRHESFDALLTTSPPHSTQILGRTIARRYKLPWIADFRDGWAGSHVVHEPTFVQRLANRRLEKRVLNAADAVLTVSPGVEDNFAGRMQEMQKLHFIPNGFDPDDFPVPEKREPGTFVFCYSGSVNAFAKPDSLLHALAHFKEHNPALAKRLRINFVGLDVLGDFEQRIRRYGLEDMIRFWGYKSHREALQHLVSADALLLIATGKPTDTFIPGKVFEYIGARKPILALSDVESTNRVLDGYQPATLCDPVDLDGIGDAIEKMMQLDWQDYDFDEAFIQQFDRKNQTEQLTEILNQL